MSVPVTWLRGLGALAVLGGICLFTLVEAAPVTPEGKSEATAEKIRKALDKPITFRSVDQPLSQIIAALREQTKINIVLDQIAVSRVAPGLPPEVISVEFEHTKLRTGLRSVLTPLNLTFVIANGTLLVTTEDVAVQRQMQQRVSGKFDKVPLKTAL